jgi:hypothetical protein
MKTEKMSLKNIKDVLSRDEMKVVMAGSNGSCGVKLSNGQSFCGMSSWEAQQVQSQNPGSYWCCASCASNGGGASYC